MEITPKDILNILTHPCGKISVTIKSSYVSLESHSWKNGEWNTVNHEKKNLYGFSHHYFKEDLLSLIREKRKGKVDEWIQNNLMSYKIQETELKNPIHLLKSTTVNFTGNINNVSRYPKKIYVEREICEMFVLLEKVYNKKGLALQILFFAPTVIFSRTYTD